MSPPPITADEVIDEIIDGVLTGLDMARPGLPLLRDFMPRPIYFRMIEWGFNTMYEGLVELRAARAHDTPEEVRARFAAKVEESAQDLALARFAAMPPDAVDRDTDPDELAVSVPDPKDGE